MVVVARVAEQQHRRLRADLLAAALPEHLERVAVVGMPVDPHDVGFGVDPVDRVGDVLDSVKNLVTSSMPSMNTNARTLENWPLIAYTSISVNRAKAATEPEMSAMTMISGFDGRG